MTSEPASQAGLSSDLLDKVRQSDTRISTRITTVRLEKAGSPMLEIRPRDIGTDQEGWAIGKEEIPCQTLEDAIIIGLEILARG
jgi:hypothetical protein